MLALGVLNNALLREKHLLRKVLSKCPPNNLLGVVLLVLEVGLVFSCTVSSIPVCGAVKHILWQEDQDERRHSETKTLQGAVLPFMSTNVTNSPVFGGNKML